MRIDFTDEDIVLADLVATVTEQLEGYNGRSGYLGTRAAHSDIRIPHRPFSGMRRGAFAAHAPAEIGHEREISRPRRACCKRSIRPAISSKRRFCRAAFACRAAHFGQSTACDENAVRVTFVAGYGTAADIPLAIKHAAKMLVGMLYNTREGGIDTKGGFGFALDALLEQHRQHGF